MLSGISSFSIFENISKSYIPFPVKIPSLKLSWYMSDIALAYVSTPPEPANIFVNKLFLADTKSIPILGCIKACPLITMFWLLSNSGLFNICDIAPISSSPEFNTKFVSESKVIIYFILGSLFSFFQFSMVFSLKGFSIFPRR